LAPRVGLALFDGSAPISIQAVANYFTDPFGDAPGQGTLLRVGEALVPRGLVLWQGRGNAFDRRLNAFCCIAGRDTGKQSLNDWRALWGRFGEQDAIVVDPGPAAKLPVSPDTPQLDRLAPPREISPEPGNPPPGVDLIRLGLKKK
jgi:hypothetical protein